MCYIPSARVLIFVMFLDYEWLIIIAHCYVYIWLFFSIFILFDAQCFESELFEKFCDSGLGIRFSMALDVWFIADGDLLIMRGSGSSKCIK